MLLLLLAVYSLGAQDETETEEEDLTEENVSLNEGMDRLFNIDKDPMQTFGKGGAVYVSNPSPLIELDPELAYYRTEWEPLILRLVTGKTTELTGRYRLVDQKFEIKTDDGIYEIYSTMLAEAQLGEDYFFVQANYGDANIYQVYFRSDDYMLLGEHVAELQEPKEQNMFDTREAKRTLKRKRTLYLRYPEGVKVELKNKKQTMTMLRIYKGSKEASFIKREKIDLKNTTDLVKLLTFMESNGWIMN